MTVNVEQTVEFSFLRTDCKARKIYPEMGDIIEYANQNYEIDNVNEVQNYAGQAAYNHSIVCSAHLTRTSALQLSKPIV